MSLQRRLLSNIYLPGKVPSNDIPIKIIPDFITEREEADLVKFANSKLRKYKYEMNHFDSVIKDYREVTTSKIPLESKILGYLKDIVPENSQKWQDFHILDLNKTGYIDYHIDNYSGEYIAGLCLLADSVMSFRKGSDEFYAYLPRRCLYVQYGFIRKEYEHALFKKYNVALPDHFNIDKQRRISILARLKQ